MFTGIIEGMGTIESIEERGDGVRLRIQLGSQAEGVKVGDSIAVSGCCLTVTGLEGEENTAASFDLIPETMQLTAFHDLSLGDRVNLERALAFGDRLDGHMVQGHVDGVARCTARTPEGGEGGQIRFDFECDDALTAQMVHKGSITIDGVSLTLIHVGEGTFAVAIIPHTLEVTGFGTLQPGDRVNIETDVVGKWILKAIGPYLDKFRQG
ncbi:MAG: riboflavin synthase [Planctomycetota bacterium]|jgi:riboflavin synthase